MCQTPCLKLKMRKASFSEVHHLMEEAGTYLSNEWKMRLNDTHCTNKLMIFCPFS